MRAVEQPEVLVLGAGFGGLTFCQSFHHPRARVTLVDRQNHHLFQPLLYQVAAAGLSAPEIAQPIRSILSDRPNTTVLMDEITAVDLSARTVALSQQRLRYDYLVLALGGVTSYFGHPEWEEFAPGLKSMDDALRIRRDVLLAFERAEMAASEGERVRLMTVVVVGGGPTGVELAGAFAELARHVLKADFRNIDSRKARILLIEAGPRILPQFSPALSESARRQLEALGVEVRTGCVVRDIRRGQVRLPLEVLEVGNIIWAAGVSASPLTRLLGADLDRAGRVRVRSDLSLPGHPEAFAIGDMALVMDDGGGPVPGVSPAAMQMARHVARQIEDELVVGREASRRPFRYLDKGTMATIGRSAAVAQIGALEFSGLLAWLSWLLIHLLFLIGLRNKLAVLLQWAYAYCAYRRGSRLITGLRPDRASGAGPVEGSAPQRRSG